MPHRGAPLRTRQPRKATTFAQALGVNDRRVDPKERECACKLSWGAAALTFYTGIETGLQSHDPGIGRDTGKEGRKLFPFKGRDVLYRGFTVQPEQGTVSQ